MMQQIVSLTSQGQISIPRKMLRHHNITKSGKVMIVPTKTGWAVEPVADFWSLRGVFHDKVIKNKSIEEVIKLEKKAMGEAMAKEYKVKLSRVNGK